MVAVGLTGCFEDNVGQHEELGLAVEEEFKTKMSELCRYVSWENCLSISSEWT